MPPLPIKIPLAYAAVLGVDVSQICHINAGRRPATIDQCEIILEAAQYDPRLSGLTIFHLRPELEQVRRFFHR